MKRAKLPDAWRTVQLGDVCTVRYGLGQPPELDPSGIPMIRATDIKDGRIVSDAVLRVKATAIPNSRNPYLRAGDILVVRSGAYTGDVAMYDGRWQTAIAGYDLVASPNREEIDSEFVTACMLGEGVQSYFRSQRDRSAQPHLNADQLKNTSIPLPPLPEQRAIARALRAVQQAKEARQREAALERERKAALMQHLFTHGSRGEATKQTEIGEMPKSWRVAALGQFILQGPQNGLYKPQEDYGAGTPIVRIDAFDNDGAFVSLDFKCVRLSPAEVRTWKLRLADVLINRVNSLTHLGKCAVVPKLAEPTVYESNMMRLQVDEERLLPAFLVRFLTLPRSRDRIRGMSKRAVAQSSINQGDVKRLLVPVPFLEEQKEIEAGLRACDDKIVAVEKEASVLDELFRALLEELMTGRLSAVSLIEPQYPG